MGEGSASAVFGQATEGQQYVTFHLNEEFYAVNALNVQEIVELVNITKVPHLPPYFKGVINLRGTIIPVVDLKLKFDMACEEYRRHTCVIVTEFSGGVMGLIVDAVSDVLHLSAESITETPSFGSSIKTDYMKGMGRVNEALVIILDVERILSGDDLNVLKQQQTH